MRVLAGALKGRRLVAPRGTTTRPTTDQVRLALLDTLTPWLPGARVLDLFAGTGGVGFEALSRGADASTFVERDPRALAALAANVDALGVASSARVIRGDVARVLPRLAAAGGRFSIVFLDPPYDGDLVAETLSRLGEGALTAPDAIVVAQHPTKLPPAAHVGCLTVYRTRRFGETMLTFYRHAAGAP
ncbi:MAG: 16S rRNA (guanine(966)-N(2))-methyltransferase RsmD [Candidatus Rokuibacteriota bacterium]